MKDVIQALAKLSPATKLFPILSFALSSTLATSENQSPSARVTSVN